MNTLKFQKIYLPATEQHNLEYEGTHIFTINGNEYAVSTPCNLNIIVTDACPCNCFFCIEHQTSSIINDISDNFFSAGLEDVLKLLDPKYVEITITGGEPTISPDRIINVMKLCRQYGYHARTFSTTGYGFIKNNDILKTMIECGFTHNINISRMCIDQNINNGIFNFSLNTNEDIRRLAMFFKYHNAEMRLSCNLIKGVVDSMEKIFEYVEYYDKLGVDSVLFRELINQLNNDEIKNRMVYLSDIFNTDDLTYMETLRSNYYDVDVYKWNNYIVKHYKTSSIKTDKISALSYKNGILRIGFTGNKIYEYGK